jgi:hypothetical protein
MEVHSHDVTIPVSLKKSLTRCSTDKHCYDTHAQVTNQRTLRIVEHLQRKQSKMSIIVLSNVLCK